MPKEAGSEDILNSPDVLNTLPAKTQQQIQEVASFAYDVTRKMGDNGAEPDKSVMKALVKAGFPTVLQTAQYDPLRLEGYIEIGDMRIDIGDPSEGES